MMTWAEPRMVVLADTYASGLFGAGRCATGDYAATCVSGSYQYATVSCGGGTGANYSCDPAGTVPGSSGEICYPGASL